MPYFIWQGVDLHAKMHKGTLFAPSEKDLDQILFKREIALISCRIKKSWNFLPINLKLKIDYLSQLNVLLKAGIRLPDALFLVAQQINHQKLSPLAYTIADTVKSGISFSNALKTKQLIFGQIGIQLIKAAEESGNLIPVLDILINHFESKASFHQKIKSALMLPLMTLGFFFAVLFILFTVIVPQFAHLFKTLNQPLPLSTQILLKVSNFLQSSLFIVIFSLVSFIFFILMRTQVCKKFLLNYALRTFLIGTLLKNKAQSSFLRSLAYLIKGGLSVPLSLVIAKEAVSYDWFLQKIDTIEDKISSGSSLYDAMITDPEQIWSPEIIALINIGQESGSLAEMLEKSAEIYEAKLSQSLNFMAMIVQPILMVILGLLITILILALYGPIFTLSYVVAP
jgi:type IV pilus assembly protein PilC